MSSEDDFFAAKLFADFNRNSLIGLKAPVLELRDAEGVSVSVPGHSERRKVLYFYDVDCSKCQVESILLANTLDHMDREVDLYAVYVGDDEDRWREYSSQRFHITSEKVNVFNLWDPDGESGMQLQYGVVQTPRLLLVDARGVIEGRRLTVEALKQLLLMDEIDDILISRNKTGDHLPEIELEGRVENNGRSREKTLRLDKFKGNPAYVIFYSESCHRCKEELDALKSHPIPGARFLFVDVDRIVADDPDLGRRLFDSFDLTLLPHIIKVDRKGVITDKYVSFKK